MSFKVLRTIWLMLQLIANVINHNGVINESFQSK